MIGGKKLRTGLIVVVCAAAAIAGIRFYLNSNLPEHTPSNMGTQEHADETEDTAAGQQPPETSEKGEQKKEVRVGEDIFLTAIEETVDGQLNISNLSAEIGEANKVTISGSVSKEEIAELLKSQADSVSSAYQAILGLLPDALPLTLELGIQPDQTQVTVVPQSFQIASMEIPGEFIDENMFEMLEQNINREISGQIGSIESIVAEDGGLLITGT